MGYEHFNTNLITNDVAKSSTKNLVPIPHECKVTSDDGSKSIEPVNENSLVFTTISNLLFDNDKINSDELNSHVKSNSDEFTSNHDTSEDSDIDNPSVPLPPPEPPDEEFDFETDFGVEISVVRNAIVKFECIDAKVKFDVFNDGNDDLFYFMFVIFDKMFSLLFAESEDTIFDPGFTPSD
nr:hypothetical protein [Tanacetum cinerariifolium]